MSSVLETQYIPAKRPYSQDELKDNRVRLHTRYNILHSIYARHSQCNHFYLVKKNGRKYNIIVESEGSENGNCSVCWKLRKTPKYLKDSAYSLVTEYENIFINDLKYLTYDTIDIERSFYTWLFKDFS